jgi:hypothetical protein
MTAEVPTMPFGPGQPGGRLVDVIGRLLEWLLGRQLAVWKSSARESVTKRPLNFEVGIDASESNRRAPSPSPPQPPGPADRQVVVVGFAAG